MFATRPLSAALLALAAGVNFLPLLSGLIRAGRMRSIPRTESTG